MKMEQALALQVDQDRCDFFKYYSYERADFLGAGCCAAVYKAKFLRETKRDFTGEIVVKVHECSDSPKLEAARSEQSKLDKLKDCALINKKIAYFEDLSIGKAYLVLEYAGEKNLSTFVEERTVAGRKLDYVEVEQLTHQLLRAVLHCHGAKIAHRDLRPDNLVVSQSEDGVEMSLKLIDFNVAWDLEKSEQIQGSTGVKEWSAPEMY